MDAQVFEQHPSAELDYSVEFAGHCARIREPATDYALNAVVLAPRSTGLQYRATTAGRTGTTEPRYPTTAGQTVTDGSVVWTAEAVSSSSLVRTLSTATWSATSGLTVGTPTNAGTKSTVLISGGVDGQDYEVTCVAECSDGTSAVASFTVQIRSRPARVVNA